MKATPVDFICRNCGEPRTTFNPREETLCRHVEADAGNPHGNRIITTHEWERVGMVGALVGNDAPVGVVAAGKSLTPPDPSDDLPY